MTRPEHRSPFGGKGTGPGPALAAIVFGLVALGLGLATAPLDAITHEAGAGSLWTETIANAAAVTPRLPSVRCSRSGGRAIRSGG